MGDKEEMFNLEVKRIGEYYYIVKGITKLKTCILPHDLVTEPKGKVYSVNLNGKFATITLTNGKQKNTGLHTDYVKRYFDM